MKKVNNLFRGDAYDTPEGTSRSWLDKLLCGSRLHFHLRNFYIFLATGLCARSGKLDQERQVHFSNKNIRLVEACGGKIHLRGLNHLRNLNGRPVILIGNHMSTLETALFHAIARPYLDFTFVIKNSLLKVPFFGDVMRSLEAIPVGRSNPRDDLRTVLKDGKTLLKGGKSIILFPQSTRSVNFSPAEFNSIGIKLAKAAEVEIVPFALKTDFIGESCSHLKDFGPIHPERDVYFEFFEPIRLAGNGRDEHQRIVELLSAKLREWGVEVRENAELSADHEE